MMNKFILIVAILYLIIVSIQYKFTVGKNTFISNEGNVKVTEEVEYNKKNLQRLEQYFLKNIEERVQLLRSGQLTYNEWIKYNKQNTTVHLNGYDYNYTVFENVDDDSFIVKVHTNEDYINLTWNVIVSLAADEGLNFTKFTIDPNLVNNMYKLGKTGENNIDFYWFDTSANLPTRRRMMFSRYFDDKTQKTGVIGVGINVDNINNEYSFKYGDIIHNYSVVVCSLLTLLISIIIIITTPKNSEYYFLMKSIIFLVLSNVYIYYFLNTTELYSSSEEEKGTIKSIRDSVLSISFLTGVNTYILTNLKQLKIKDTSLYFQNTVLFGIGIFLLLLATFKFTNYVNTRELTTDRISLQLVFNFAIIINMLILLNYTAFYLFNKVKFHMAFLKT